jgi:hypothetical protein
MNQYSGKITVQQCKELDTTNAGESKKGNLVDGSRTLAGSICDTTTQQLQLN